MIEINWSEIDPKYKYFTIDEDGFRAFYLAGDKPYICEPASMWNCEEEILSVPWDEEYTPDWRESLQERPME